LGISSQGQQNFIVTRLDLMKKMSSNEGVAKASPKLGVKLLCSFLIKPLRHLPLLMMISMQQRMKKQAWIFATMHWKDFSNSILL
jgi:hypothetical protein